MVPLLRNDEKVRLHLDCKCNTQYLNNDVETGSRSPCMNALNTWTQVDLGGLLWLIVIV